MIKVFFEQLCVAEILGHQSYAQALQGMIKEMKIDLWMFRYFNVISTYQAVYQVGRKVQSMEEHRNMLV